MITILKKELKILSCSLTGYIFSAIFLLSFACFSLIYNLINCQASFSSVISLTTLPMLVLVPILTMRSFAEERHQKSDQLIFSLPIDIPKYVLGKYAAMVIWILMPFVIVCLYPLWLSKFGDINLLATYGALLAFFLVLCAMVAVGMFISSLTDNQMVAASISFLLFLAVYLLPVITPGISTSGKASLILFTVIFLLLALAVLAFTKNIVVSGAFFAIAEIPVIIMYLKDIRLLSGKFAAVLDSISFFNSLGVFTAGIFDISAIVLYLSVSILFLFFTVETLERRRWN